VTAFNIYGESPPSNTILVRTATKPSTMSPVTVTQSGTDVIISWSPAQANGD